MAKCRKCSQYIKDKGSNYTGASCKCKTPIPDTQAILG